MAQTITAEQSVGGRDWDFLSVEQMTSFADRGYIHLKAVFDADTVRRGLAAVERLNADRPHTTEWHASFTDRSHTLRIRNAIACCPELAEFLDHPGLVGPLVSLLSPSLQILGTEVFVRSCHDQPLEDWHTDGGAYLQRIQLASGSQSLQLKAQVFLTDVSRPDSGNFVLIPGSDRVLPRETGTCYLDEYDVTSSRPSDDAVTVLADPGDVLIFPYSLWHAVAPNTYRPRVTFIFRYGQLWHRPNDYLKQPPEILESMSDRLRRMFGYLGHNPHPLDFYKPQDQEAVMARGGGSVVPTKPAGTVAEEGR